MVIKPTSLLQPKIVIKQWNYDSFILKNYSVIMIRLKKWSNLKPQGSAISEPKINIFSFIPEHCSEAEQGDCWWQQLAPDWTGSLRSPERIWTGICVQGHWQPMLEEGNDVGLHWT